MPVDERSAIRNDPRLALRTDLAPKIFEECALFEPADKDPG